MAAVLADAAALAAWQALDVGAINRAWTHHETARYGALEARDPVLLAHAMAQQAFVLIDIGEMLSAQELVAEAWREAGQQLPPRFKAWLHAAEAEIAAASGDRGHTARSFDRAATALSSSEEAVDPDMPFIVLNEAHLARWRGNALARLGVHGAVGELYKALNDGGSASDRAAASLRCDLAQALSKQGDYAEARIHAVEARRLARRSGSVRQRRRIDRLAFQT